MLTNFEIIDLAKKLNINLVTICSKDELIKIAPKVGGYIINLENIKRGHGTHWTSFILYQTPDQGYNSLYFDSYGMRPPIEIENYIKQISKNKQIPYNTRQIQKIETSECGWYCLSFLYNMQYKRLSDNIIDDYNNYMSKYSNNLNDELKILKASFKPFTVNFYNKTIKLLKN
jgi:hypothetical protein